MQHLSLNIFYFEEDNHHCGSCETSADHEYWMLLTELSEDELKARMRVALSEEMMSFHRGHFLSSLSDEGILLHASDYLEDPDNFKGGWISGFSLDLRQIRDADILLPESFSELLRKREEEAQRRREEEAAQDRARQRARDLADLKRLQAKYPDLD